MSGNSRGGLFRPRNVLGAALIAGIGLGIYLGPLLKGLGLGGGNTIGINGQNSSTQAHVGTTGQTSTSGNETRSSQTNDENSTESSTVPDTAPVVVKVLIDDRSFFLRQADREVPVDLPQLIKLVKMATGDPDGFKIRIYERASARVSAEEALKEALVNAEIPDATVLWVPSPVK